MKTRSIQILSLLLACLLAVTALTASADTAAVEADGTVINTSQTPVTACCTGVIDRLNVREGSHVQKGDTIAVLKTDKVYASEAGTVRLFGVPGDSAEMLTAHYGAVAYIEPAVRYTVSASTNSAYNSVETKTVHPGETVFLRAGTHAGTGQVTKVSGTSFSIDVLDGTIEPNDSVYVYRDEANTYSQRIGYGSVSKADYTAYEGSGIIAGYCVENGSEVSKGDALFETVEGDFAGYGTDLTQIKAPADGVIGSLSVSAGGSVTAGDSVCTLYPDAYMRVEAELDEESLAAMPAGSPVKVTFTYYGSGAYSFSGTVEQVSAVASESESSGEESSYKIIVCLSEPADVRYGMSVTVTIP